MEAPSALPILRVLRDKGYMVFHDKRGHDLNIVGIRTADLRANRFNDWLVVLYWFDAEWTSFAFRATTDPGTFWRENPMNVQGTAILKPGQYRDAHQLGVHKGLDALVQAKPVTVYRDANRDGALDVSGVPEDFGMFGINIHRSNTERPSVQVDRWSAGCQVVQDPDHFQFLLTLCRRAASKYGDSFTYTLLTEEDFG